MNFGITSSTLYIQYTLWGVARNRRLFVTPGERRRRKILAILLCYGLPLLFVVLHYIVQGHRYDVAEDLGPMPTTYGTNLSYLLYWVWDPILCFIAALLSAHTYWMIFRHQKEMSKVFVSSQKNSETKYYRLLLMTFVLTLLHLPIILFIMFHNIVEVGVVPWISWEDTHSDYMRIAYLSRTIIETIPDFVMMASLSYWSIAFCGFSYFAFFGTGTEARRQYRMVLEEGARRLGIQLPKRKAKQPSKNSPPSKQKRSWLDRLLGRRTADESFLSTLGTSTTSTTITPSFGRKKAVASSSANTDRIRPDETIVISPSIIQTFDSERQDDVKRYHRQSLDGEDAKGHPYHQHSWMEMSTGDRTSRGEEEDIDLEAMGSGSRSNRRVEQEQHVPVVEPHVPGEPAQEPAATEEITF
ncbi:a-factor receptor [Serendipita sp. 399]|nr:a-factor receptor [Serendipita sp. 399]